MHYRKDFMMSATIFAFVKIFEEKEYAESFLRGELYMNTIRSFKEYTDKSGELRGDSYEGIIAIHQPNKLSGIKINDVEISSSALASPILIHGDYLLNQNVFCIYSLNSRGYDQFSAETLKDFKETLQLHELCFGLGCYCVVILNASDFISRCEKAIRKLNLQAKLALVDYFDEEEFHGFMPKEKLGFQKRNMFAHQREYRIKIDINQSDPRPFTLDVGDLSDISILMKPQEFNDSLNISLPNGAMI